MYKSSQKMLRATEFARQTMVISVEKPPVSNFSLGGSKPNCYT